MNDYKIKLETAIRTRKQKEDKVISYLKDCVKSEVEYLNKYISIFKSLSLGIINRIKGGGYAGIKSVNTFRITPDNHIGYYYTDNADMSSHRDNFVFTEEYLYDSYDNLRFVNPKEFEEYASNYCHLIKCVFSLMADSNNLDINTSQLNIVFHIEIEKDECWAIKDKYFTLKNSADERCSISWDNFDQSKEKILDLIFDTFLEKIEKSEINEVYLGDLNE